MHCSDHHYDIIAVTETFLTVEIGDSTTALEGFTMHRPDREGKGGSGLAVYVRHSFNVKVFIQSDLLSRIQLNFYFLRSDICSQKVLFFAAIYRRSHAADPTQFFNILETFKPSYSNIVIIRDSNMDILRDSVYLLNQIAMRALCLVPLASLIMQLVLITGTIHCWISSSFKMKTLLSNTEKPWLLFKRVMPSLR